MHTQSTFDIRTPFQYDQNSGYYLNRNFPRKNGQGYNDMTNSQGIPNIQTQQRQFNHIHNIGPATSNSFNQFHNEGYYSKNNNNVYSMDSSSGSYGYY